MDKHTIALLGSLRNQRTPEGWATRLLAWEDLRGMIPLALVGNFSLDKHIATIAKYDDHNNLPACFKMGIKDWFGSRCLKTCLQEPGEWLLWLQEYKQALTISSEYFKKETPAQIVASVFDEFHHLQHLYPLTFVVNKPERLQVALLHIEHLPESSSLYGHDLALWAKASPETREAAAPEIAQWYNLVQDEQMLSWHVKNKHPLDATSYALPNDVAYMNGVQ